jgi:hypothetical protein
MMKLILHILSLLFCSMHLFGQAPVHLKKNGRSELLGFPDIKTTEDSSLYAFEENSGKLREFVDSIARKRSGAIEALYIIQSKNDLVVEIKKIQYYRKDLILILTDFFVDGKPYQHNRKKAYLKNNAQFDSTSYASLVEQLVIYEDYSMRFILSEKSQSIDEVLYAFKTLQPPPDEYKQYGLISKSRVKLMASKVYVLYDDMEKNYFLQKRRFNKLFELSRYTYFPYNEKQRILWDDYWKNYYDSLSVSDIQLKFETIFSNLDSLKNAESFDLASKLIESFEIENDVFFDGDSISESIDPEIKWKFKLEKEYCERMKMANTHDKINSNGFALLQFMVYPNDSYCINRIHSILERLEENIQSNWLNSVFNNYLKKDYDNALLNLKNHLQNNPNDILAESLKREIQHQSNQNQELLNALKVADIYYQRNDFNMSGGLYRSILIDHPNMELCITRLEIIRSKIN